MSLAALIPATTTTAAAAVTSSLLVRVKCHAGLLASRVRCPSVSQDPDEVPVQVVASQDGCRGVSRSGGAITKARSCQPPRPPWQPTSGSKAATSRVTGSTALLT